MINTNNLKQNLYSKQNLKFHENGKFKMLMFSDMQESLQYDNRSLKNLDSLIEKEKPDLVILGGDNCDGTILKTKEELQQYLNIFTKPMEIRKIPWIHVFGNHDHDLPIEDMQIQELYEAFPFCISKHTTGIPGVTNFVLPIKASKTDKTVFHIWGLDTNHQIDKLKRGLKEDTTMKSKEEPISQWDIVRFEQLMWYWNSSVELEAYYQQKIKGMLIMHIAPWESKIIKDNPVETNLTGSTIEKLGLSAINSGIFATVLQRGDIGCIASGHSHENTFDGSYCGIRICLDGSAGYHAYGDDNLKGVRVFELNEQNLEAVQTHMVYYKDL
ncbi:MAG: metallophosphoesterase [Clostridia bacterium]